MPPNKNFTTLEIEQVIDQLTPPYIVLGDMNSHHSLWGSTQTDSKGRKIEKLLDDNKILLNDGSATHFCTRTGTLSAIDLTICHATLSPSLSWEALSQLWRTDHFPIIMNLPQPPLIIPNRPKKWNFKKADWELYRQLTRPIEYTISPEANIDSLINNFTSQIREAAEVAIGYKKSNHKHTTLWWNSNCRNDQRALKNSLARYKKTKDVEDLIQLKKDRAKFRRTVLENKKRSWENYTSTITESTPPTEV